MSIGRPNPLDRDKGGDFDKPEMELENDTG